MITGVVVAPGINLMAFAYGKERNVTAGSETLPAVSLAKTSMMLSPKSGINS